MGIHVIQSQHIQVLVQGVLQSLSKPSKNPFQVLSTEHFVVPSPAIQEWLTQTIAEQQGISANHFYHQRIRGFQWYCYQQVLSDKDHVRKANIPRLMMKWRIYQTLKPYIEAEHEQLDQTHPLHSIIQRIDASAAQLPSGFEKQLKKQSMLYWVAEQVSKLFTNYMLYRGECFKGCGELCRCPTNWLGQWGRNQALDVEQYLSRSQDQDVAFKLEQAQQLEAWQRWLWQHTFHDDFVEMQSIDAEFWQIMDDPDQRKMALKALPERVILFTMLDLAPAQLHFLRRLGQYVDVLILHYNPSQEYWADSVDPNWKKRYDLRIKERYIERHPQATDAEIQTFFEAFTLNFNAEVRESRHPLLTRFGKQARDHFSILSNLSSGEEGQWVDAFVDDFPQHLLGKVQSDILNLVEPEPHAYALQANDDSIQIHVCHSSLRQLEVLKDQLVAWLSQTDTDQPRRPSDILVLTPDLKQMEPLIRSVFPQTSHQHGVYLPVKIAGVTQLDLNNAWRAVLGRIDLVSGRFTVEDFSDWLSLTATQIRYGLDLTRTERMIQLLIDAGFKRGLDEQHLQQSLSLDDTDYRFSFKYALDRLAIGIAVPMHAVCGDILAFADVQSADFELIASLIDIYEDFAQRRDWLLLHEKGKGHPVEKWLEILKQEIDEFIQAGVESLQAVHQVVRKQYTMLTLSYNYDMQKGQGQPQQHELYNIQLPLPYLLQEIQNTLDSQLEHALPTGQITFSQIGHIRPVPYKLVVVLNLDTGRFPNRNTQVPFDLMALFKPLLGDRSRLEDDQGAFLDALLLAQDNLWLFYNGFDVSDGEVREPSSVLQELIQHLALISSTTSIKEDESSIEQGQNPQAAEMEKVEGILVPRQLKSLFHVHVLQPFDPLGFAQPSNIRFQDQWFSVAKSLSQPSGHRTGWINQPYPYTSDELQVIDANQWMNDITFPARLYLKTLGVENLKAEDLPAQQEPLVLDGLGRYAIREFLQHQDINQLDTRILTDRLPVGKVQHSVLNMSLAEHHRLKKRLLKYASEPTKTTQRQWRVSPEMLLNVTVPMQAEKKWVSLNASSARAKRRAKTWLEYLLWLNYLNLPDQHAQQLERIAIFSDVTLRQSGLTTTQAKAYLSVWFEAYRYAQSEPLVLPAALMLLWAEKGKEPEWYELDGGGFGLSNFSDVLKEWNKSEAYLSFSLADMEWSKKHRDWQFILEEQDATALLHSACDRFAYALYAPIYQYQQTVED